MPDSSDGRPQQPLKRPAPALSDASLAGLIKAARQARRQGDNLTALELFLKAQRSAAEADDLVLTSEVADTLRRLGRLAEAEAFFHTVLARAPSHAAALSGLARCAKNAGDHATALRWFVAAAAQAGSAPGAYQDLADAQLQAGLPDQAAVNYRRVLARAPNSSVAMSGLAKCARRIGDRQAALTHSQLACAAAPDNLLLRVHLADDLRELDRLDEAEAELSAVIAREPNNVVALLAAARLARKQRQAEKLLGFYERVRAIDPEDTRAIVGLIAANREFGDVATARTLANEFLKRAPDQVQAHIELGMLERVCGNHLAAQQAFRAADRLEPGRIEIALNMARECLALGDRAQGDALIADALARDPSNVQAKLLAAQGAMMVDDHLTALTILKNGLNGQPDHVGLLTAAAEALGRLGRVTEAMVMLDAAQRIPGNQTGVTVKRLVLLRQMGLWTEAIDLARAANAATPNTFLIKQELLRLCLLIGTETDIERSLAALVPASTAERAQFATMRGLIAEEYGELRAAIGHYQEAIALLPTGAEPYRVLARTHVLAFDFPSAVSVLRQHAAIIEPMNRLRQRSPNWSQTHIGQTVIECMLDKDAYDAVQSLLQLAPDDRREPLFCLMRTYADNTLVALALIDALWCTGTFDRPRSISPSSACATIPRRIVQFWDAAEPPVDIAALMGTWLIHNPCFDYVRFDEDAAERFLAERHPTEVLQAYRRALQPAKKADLFRLAYLLVHGGIYVDADDRCRASLLPLLPLDADLVLYREDVGTLGNNFIAALPGHAVVHAALDQAVTAINRGDDELLWLATGPGLITRALAQQVSHALDADVLLARTKIWDRRSIYQSVAMHCVTAHKRTKSYWGNVAFQQSTTGVRKMTITAEAGSFEGVSPGWTIWQLN